MKNALILHGTDSTPKQNWFSWLGKELEKLGYSVWIPQLPKAETPSVQRYNKYLLNADKFEFNKDSILIGHSSGSVAILGLLEQLPSDVKVDTCYLVGSFKDDLGRDSLKDLFSNPFNFELIKQKVNKFVFIHSNNDPYCPLEHAKYLSEKLNAKLIVKKGQKHFSVDTMGEQYRQFPLLLELIK